MRLKLEAVAAHFTCMIITLTAVVLLAASADAGVPSVAELETRALSAYNAKDYSSCAQDFSAAAARVRGARDQRSDLYSAACCEALAGQKDQALKHLERASELGLRQAAEIQADGDLTSLADEPRFRAVVEQVAARDRTPDPDRPSPKPTQPPTEPVRCELSAAEKEALLALEFWDFDQSPKGWRQFPRDERGRAAQANDEQCERLTLDLVETYAARYETTLTASQRRILTWHAGQVAAFLGDTTKALGHMKRTLDANPEWNAYVRASIAFLEHDRARLVAERETLAAIDTDLRMRVNLRIVDSFVRCFDSTYRAAYMKTCQPETPSDLIRSLAIKLEPTGRLSQGVSSLLLQQQAVFVSGEPGVQQVPQVFAQVVSATAMGPVSVVLDVGPATQRAVERFVQTKQDDALQKDKTTHGQLAPLVKQLAAMPNVKLFAGALGKLDLSAKAKASRLLVLTSPAEGVFGTARCGSACQVQKALGEGSVFNLLVRHEKGTRWACAGQACAARPVTAAPQEYATAVPWDLYFLQEDKPRDGFRGTVFVREARTEP